MKIFISQPMRGKTQEEIIEARASALEKFDKYFKNNKIGTSYEVIDTFFEDYKGVNPVGFLARSIDKGLSNADIAIFLPGWNEARGCSIEHDVATAYGIKTFYINT